MVIFADTGVADKDGIPEKVKVYQRGNWNMRMVVEGVFFLLNRVCQSKKMYDKVWAYFEMRIGFLTAIFNLLISCNGIILVDDDGYFHHSIKEFML